MMSVYTDTNDDCGSRCIMGEKGATKQTINQLHCYFMLYGKNWLMLDQPDFSFSVPIK